MVELVVWLVQGAMGGPVESAEMVAGASCALAVGWLRDREMESMSVSVLSWPGAGLAWGWARLGLKSF